MADAEKKDPWIYSIAKDMIAGLRRSSLIAHALPTRQSVFEPSKPAPGVAPDSAKIAMDAVCATTSWDPFSFSMAEAEGMTFMGFPHLSILAQRAEYRIISNTLAEDMVRRWIRIKASSDDGNKTEKIEKIEKEFKRLKVRHHFRRAAELDGFFGRAHVAPLFDVDPDDREELVTPIGNGRNSVSQNKIGIGALKGLRVIEPYWTYPGPYNSVNPFAPDFYRPELWYVNSIQVHHTRLLTMIGREVPDLLKPAYQFAGLSLTQMSKPYVDNWVKVRQSVTDMVYKYSVNVLKTQMADAMVGSRGKSLEDRADFFNAMRDSRGLLMLDKDTEDFVNVSSPLSGLHELQAQAQEHMAAVSKIPLVKFTGISPSGLNASSEGEIQVYQDLIHALQEILFADPLEALLGMVQLSLFGEVDPDIEFEFLPLEELNEKELAEVRDINAKTDQTLIDAGVIAPVESRQRVAKEDSSPYAGIDVDDVPDLEIEEEQGLEPTGKGNSSKGAMGGSGHAEFEQAF